MLRISGKRTLSQMKEFDFIVTVALGSTLATVLLNKSITLLDGVTGLGLLILLQYLLAAWSVRSKTFSKIISSEPTLIFFKGDFLPEALRKERVTENEVRSVLRSQKINSLDDVEAVVMESNGQFSVVPKAVPANQRSTLAGVKYPKDA
nr:YetF domain-containing protein [Mucilaginibacter sp. JXJ CY 39]